MSLIRLAARIGIGLALMVGPIIGCGNTDDYYPYYPSPSAGFGGSTSSSSGYFYGDAGGAELCSTVAEGVSCYNNHAPSCEQGPGANANCNVHLTCSGGVWEKDQPQRSLCAPTSACPGTYTETVGDDLCKRPDALTLLCEYDEGTCGCAPVGGVVKKKSDPKDAGDAGDADAEIPADAGTSPEAGTRAYEWKCVHADRDAGCPRRRPREGIDCVRPLNCDYGYCVFEDGYRMDCYQGSWVRDPSNRSEQCDQ